MFVTEAGEIDFEDDEDEEEVEDRDGEVGTWNLVNFLNVHSSVIFVNQILKSKVINNT